MVWISVPAYYENLRAVSFIVPIKSILGLKDETEPTVVAEKLKNLIQEDQGITDALIAAFTVDLRRRALQVITVHATFDEVSPGGQIPERSLNGIRENSACEEPIGKLTGAASPGDGDPEI